MVENCCKKTSFFCAFAILCWSNYVKSSTSIIRCTVAELAERESLAVAVGVTDMWLVTQNMWHVTLGTWHMTCDTLMFFVYFCWFLTSLLLSADVKRFRVPLCRIFFARSEILRRNIFNSASLLCLFDKQTEGIWGGMIMLSAMGKLITLYLCFQCPGIRTQSSTWTSASCCLRIFYQTWS